MFRRSMLAFVVVVALLALVTPALAGGWAVVTLDTLPREVRAGQALQLGFVVRQHGKTPTNQDLDGKPLKPVVIAIKQGGATSSQSSGTLMLVSAPAQRKGEETIRAEARQAGAVGHYLVDMTFPSDGVWDWRIEVPTYYVQNGPNGQEGNAAIFAPLTVLPAAPAAAQAAPAAPATAPAPAAATFLGVDATTLRWGGAILLLVALVIGLYSQRGLISRRLAIR
jgi:hypothetical protein